MLSIALKVLFRRGEEHEETSFSNEVYEALTNSGMRCYRMRGVSFICIGEKSVVILRRLSPITVRGIPEADALVIRVVCGQVPPTECALPAIEVVYEVARRLDKPVIPL